jgi:hypothetical protein
MNDGTFQVALFGQFLKSKIIQEAGERERVVRAVFKNQLELRLTV